MSEQRSPLHWPPGWRRTPASERKYGQFASKGTGYLRTDALTVAQATKRVLNEVKHLTRDMEGVVISTNLMMRLDGLPRSGQKEPADPGVALYWTDLKGRRKCIAVDHYTKLAQNIAAVAATISAMRAIERHGSPEILDRIYTGFEALPAPDQVSGLGTFDAKGDIKLGTAKMLFSEPQPRKPWWEVLGVPRGAPEGIIRSTYKKRRSQAHPDSGGSEGWFDEVQKAWEDCQAERGFK